MFGSIILLGFTIALTEAGFFQKTVLKIHEFKGYCDDFGITKMGFENITLKTDSTRMTKIDTIMVIREDLMNKYRFDIKVEKCRNKELLDSCISFKTFKLPDICRIFDAKNQVWTPFMTQLQPKMTCPLQKGVYTVKDGYFDLSYSPIKVETNAYWKVGIQNFDLITNDVVFCAQLEVEALPIKNV